MNTHALKLGEAEGADYHALHMEPSRTFIGTRTKWDDEIPSRNVSERRLPPGTAIVTMAVFATAAWVLLGLAWALSRVVF